MRRITSSFVLIGCLALTSIAAAHGHGGTGGPCPPDPVAAVQAACPCAGRSQGGTIVPWARHGAYVSCVVHAAKALHKARCLDRDVKRELGRCADASTVGRPGAVVCATSKGLRIAARAARCVAAGGEVRGEGSVCEPSLKPTPTSTSSTHVPSTTTSTTSTTNTTSTTTLPMTTFGNPDEFAGASDHSAGYLLGGPVVVDHAITMAKLGVIAKVAGPRVVLALYTDGGAGPHTLVAATAPTAMAHGANDLYVPSTAIPAGTYWLMASYESDASVGIDETVDAVVHYAGHAAGGALPDPFVSWGWYPGQRFNYYLRGLE